jgi:glycosyltransferase involved in cell wall biosynthesis
MRNVLVISSDTIDENMAGMGVRYWEIACALAATCQVTLAIANVTQLKSDRIRLVSFDREHGDLNEYARQADVIIIQGFTLHFHPYLRGLGIPIAVDLYVPYLLESLVWHENDDLDVWKPAYEEYLRVQLELLLAGDFFFCASDRQRDYWLGWLHAQKRINPHTFHDDPTCRKLIDVVPFGIPNEPPPPHHPVLKGILPGIPEDCRLVLWNGGLWDWLDPLTLITAIANLYKRHSNIRLYFMGSQHPNAIVSGMTMTEKAIQLSKDLGIYNQVVFFGDWVPYQERTHYLKEADLGVVTHLDHIETHFSFRTRLLDCIWTGLPIVSTSGDFLAEKIKNAGVGITVPPKDSSSLENAIETILFSSSFKIPSSAWDQLRFSFRWENAVEPLLRFCLNPVIAPDKTHYLTEVERSGHDKDMFLQQVIRDKDAFLEQVIQSKDAFYNEIIREKITIIEKYQKMLPIRIYNYISRKILRKP